MCLFLFRALSTTSSEADLFDSYQYVMCMSLHITRMESLMCWSNDSPPTLIAHATIKFTALSTLGFWYISDFLTACFRRTHFYIPIHGPFAA